MTAKTKKNITAISVLLLLAAAVTGYLVYNKKHFSVQTATPAATLNAAELHNTFATDSATAKIKFTGDENNKKVIQVTGEVAEVKTNQQANTIILLKTNTDGAFINCTMEQTTNNIKTGSKIAIKGICSGYNFDAEMGIPGDVILIRSIVIQ